MAQQISTTDNFGVSISRTFKPLRRLMYSSNTARRTVFTLGLCFAVLFVLAGSYVIGATNYGVFVVLGFVAIVFGIAMVVRPDIAMILLVASIYTNSSDVLEVSFGIPSTNKALVALTFVSVIGTRAIIQKKPLRFAATEIAIVLYMLVAVMSLFVSGQVGLAMEEIVDFVKDLAIVIIVVQLTGEEQTWKRMIWALVISAGILGTMTVYQGLTGSPFEFWGYANAPVHEIVAGYDDTRPTGPLDDPNYYSQLILMAQPMAFYIWFTNKNKVARGLAFFFWAMIVFAVILTYSRSSFLALAGIMFVIALERKMDMVRLAFFGAIALTILTPMLPKGYLDRLSTITSLVTGSSSVQEESSFTGRASEAIAALMMFQDHILFGVGYGMYESNYLDYSAVIGLDRRYEARAAHSLYLEVMAETGIIGIASFSGMIATFYIVSNRAIRQLKEIGRDDLIPWIRSVQFGFLSYMLTSVFLHDDWVRFFRLGLAIMASCAALGDTVVAKHYQQQALLKAREGTKERRRQTTQVQNTLAPRL